MEVCEVMKDRQLNGRFAANTANSMASAAKGRSKGRPLSSGLPGRPRGSIPIHVDGSRDELAEVDPDLALAELEWRWAHEGDGGLRGQARCAGLPRNAGSAYLATRTSSTQLSRARPIKPHETEPFLAVGEVIRDTKQTLSAGPSSACSSAGHWRARVRPRSAGQRAETPVFSSVVNGRVYATLSSQGPGSDSVRSAFSSPTPSLRAQSARSQGRRSAKRMYVPPNSATPRPNPHVKLPFKHNVRSPSQMQSQEPSRDLKERTALATHHVHQVLASSPGGTSARQRGKLLQKGRLKPLYPVCVSGPSIQHCRGILSETRTYRSSLSRSLQHRRHVIAQIKSGDLDLDLDENAEPLVEGYDSVHRVSAASSLEDVAGLGKEQEVEEEEEEGGIPAGKVMEEERAVPEEDKMAKDSLSQHSFSMATGGKCLTSQSDVQSTSGPTDQVQNAAAVAMEETERQLPSTVHSEGGSCGSTTLDHTNPKTAGKKEKENNHRNHHRDLSTGGVAHSHPTAAAITANIMNTNSTSVNATNNTGDCVRISATPNHSGNSSKVGQLHAMFSAELKRPQSASVHYSEPVPPKSPAKERPRTAASVKAVRFADMTDSSGTGTVSGSWVASNKSAKDSRGESGRKRGMSGQSCKPADFSSKHHQGDDDDDKGGGGGGGGRAGESLSRGTVGSGNSAGSRATEGGPISSEPQQSGNGQMRQVVRKDHAGIHPSVADVPVTSTVLNVPVSNHSAGVPGSGPIAPNKVVQTDSSKGASCCQPASNVDTVMPKVKTAPNIKTATSNKTASNLTTAENVKDVSSDDSGAGTDRNLKVCTLSEVHVDNSPTDQPHNKTGKESDSDSSKRETEAAPAGIQSPTQSRTAKLSNPASLSPSAPSILNTSTVSSMLSSATEVTPTTNSKTALAIAETTSTTSTTLAATSLQITPSPVGFPESGGSPMVWQRPPVTWSPMGDEGVTPGMVPDSDNLLKLLLDVLAEVTPPSAHAPLQSGHRSGLSEQLIPFLGQENRRETSTSPDISAVDLTDKTVDCRMRQDVGQVRSVGASIRSSGRVVPSPPAETEGKQVVVLARRGSESGQEGSQTQNSLPGQVTVLKKDVDNEQPEQVIRWGFTTQLSEEECDLGQVAHRQPLPAQSNSRQQQVHGTQLSSQHTDRQKRRKKRMASTVTTLMQPDHGVNPRIGVFACYHRDSPRKAEGALVLKEDNSPEKSNDDDDEDDRNDHQIGDGSSQKKYVEDLAEDELDASDPPAEDVCMSELFTLFSLGSDESTSSARDYGNPFDHKRQPHTLQTPGNEKNASSDGHALVTGILKKRKDVLDTQTEKKKLPGNQPAAKMPVDKSGEDQHQRPHAKMSQKRQTYTPLSSAPFVFPSENPHSQAIAERLKFGNSPYLQHLKVPKAGASRQQGKIDMVHKARGGRSVKTAGRNKSADRGEKRIGRLGQVENVHGVGGSTPLPTRRRRRTTKVQFADCSAQMVDVNHNCVSSEQSCSVCTRQGAVGEDADDHGLQTQDSDIYEHEDDPTVPEMFGLDDGGAPATNDEPDTFGISWQTPSGRKSCNKDIHLQGDDDFINDVESPCDENSCSRGEEETEAGFAALEAELSAVRSQLQQDIWLSQKQLALDTEDTPDRQDTPLAAHPSSDEDELSDSEDDDFVYEDYGSSDDDETDGIHRDKTEKDETQGDDNDGDDDSDDDNDEAYSTYYRALLLDYRRKCLMAGEGNLVISDTLTWPVSAHTVTLSSTASHTRPRPYSAGAFRTLEERRQAMAAHQHGPSAISTGHSGLHRTFSQSDSGWESDQESDSRGRAFDRWNSQLSVDGEHFGSSLSDARHSATQREGTVEHHPGESSKGREQRRGRQCGGSRHVMSGVSASRPSSGREDHPQFEIKASPIPKPPSRSKASPSGEGPTAPFPPLCFAITGRAPPGFVFFFTYATYMNPNRLGTLIHRPVDKRYWAVLFGFELTFNKLGGEWSGGGGLPNIVFNPFSSVEGCVVLLTPSELQYLDAFTGGPQHYSRVVLPVWMSDVSGSAEDCGLARHCVAAVTYIAGNEWSGKDACVPSEFVASQCLKSADLLTPNYCERLQSLVSATTSCPQPPAPAQDGETSSGSPCGASTDRQLDHAQSVICVT